MSGTDASSADRAEHGGADADPPARDLARTLGLRPRARLLLRHVPDGWRLPGLPEGVVTTTLAAEADTVLAFYRSADALRAEAVLLASEVADATLLWIAWPRRAAGHRSDVDEALVRAAYHPLGMAEEQAVVLDANWSAQAFRRSRDRRDRPGGPHARVG